MNFYNALNPCTILTFLSLFTLTYGSCKLIKNRDTVKYYLNKVGGNLKEVGSKVKNVGSGAIEKLSTFGKKFISYFKYLRKPYISIPLVSGIMALFGYLRSIEILHSFEEGGIHVNWNEVYYTTAGVFFIYLFLLSTVYLIYRGFRKAWEKLRG